MKPGDLQLPSKFGEFRQGQLETSAKIGASGKYAYLLDAPTGIGKSLIAATVQRLSNKNIVYTCTTKQLQDQLVRDFPYAKTIKGRNNYRCLKYPQMFPEISASECSHKPGNECEDHQRCPYMIAKMEALNSPMAILNLAYFLSEVNFVGMFSGRGLLVIDEFDTTEGQLMNFVEVIITQRQLGRLDIPPPKYRTKFQSWVDWAVPTLRVLEAELRQLEEATSGGDWDTVDIKAIRRKRDLSRLTFKLRFFVSEVDKNWVWYAGSDRWSFKPIWVSKYAANILWKHAKKVLGMSATILDPRQVASNTGLTADDKSYSYQALPSPFPKENRPVYYEPCANVTAKRMDVALPALTRAIKGIMEKHPDDHILIHTVSYKVRDYLKNNLQSERIISHGPQDRTQVLDKFKNSKRPLVLLSPSMDRGVDLPDDACRVVVIAKCPYPDLGDVQTSKRVHASKDGNNWYAHKTISTIVQMAGRGVRSESDYAITYILDEQFGRLYSDHITMFPAWFKEAVIM